MSEKDETLMREYGITCENKMIYLYKEHRYENLKDALNFARVDAENLEDTQQPPVGK